MTIFRFSLAFAAPLALAGCDSSGRDDEIESLRAEVSELRAEMDAKEANEQVESDAANLFESDTPSILDTLPTPEERAQQTRDLREQIEKNHTERRLRDLENAARQAERERMLAQ